MHFKKSLCAQFLSLLLLGGCALPAAGPMTIEVEHPRRGAMDFVLVDVTPDIYKRMTHGAYVRWPSNFSVQRYTPSLALRPGDVIAITVYESGGSFIFGPPAVPDPTQSSSVRTSSVPAQVVEPNGAIMVPFVGRVTVNGLTPQQAASKIEQSLKSQTVRPQVVVSVVSAGSTGASVGGEVNKPGTYPLTLRGERILDMIAMGGGPKYPSMDTSVRLVRGGEGHTVALQAIINNPELNVVVRPNDDLYMLRTPRTFSVMGASQKVSQYTFDTDTVSLAEGVARSGGIIDTVGSPNGVYLLRNEPGSLINEFARIAPDAVVDPGTQRPVVAGDIPPSIDVVYRVNLRTADGYFAASRISLNNKDIILVANAEATQLIKLFTVARGITGIAYDLSRSGGN